MPKKGYNKSLLEKSYKSINSSIQPTSFGDSTPSVNYWMPEEEHNTKLENLSNKEEDVLKEMDIIEAEAKKNSESIEQHKNRRSALESESNNKGIIAKGLGVFGYGDIARINNEIHDIDIILVEHELRNKDYRNKIRELVESQTSILSSKREIKRMFMDSENEKTDGYRVSIRTKNFRRICKFIEISVQGFMFIDSYHYALMYEVANEIENQNKGFNFNLEIISYEMLESALSAMPIFQSPRNFKAFLQSAQEREEANKRERDQVLQQAANRMAEATSKMGLSLVNPQKYEANPQKHEPKSYSSKSIVQKLSGTKKPKKDGGSRRAHRSRKSKK
jgi:hypothetical protein